MTTSSAPPPDELVFSDLLGPLARRWRLLVAAPLVAAALALVLALVWPKTYAAETTFTPEQASGGGLASMLGSLGGLGGVLGAATGGLPSGLGAPATSPEFFAGLLGSRELLAATLASRFDAPGRPGVRLPLIDIMRPRGDTPERRAGNALRKLKGRTTAVVDRRTSMVTLTVTLSDPKLAAAVAQRMVDLLNEYNLGRRQFSSREQRRFLTGRLEQADEDLRAAERAHSTFLAQNRYFEGSPMLEEQERRLRRDVQVRQEIALSLRKSFEDARIAEVRDTPVLSIVDHAAPPDRPANPRPVLWTALGGFLGLLVATVLIFSTAARSPAHRVAAPSGAGEMGPRAAVALADASEGVEAVARAKLRAPARQP